MNALLGPQAIFHSSYSNLWSSLNLYLLCLAPLCTAYRNPRAATYSEDLVIFSLNLVYSMQTEAAGEVGGWTGGAGILPVLADRWLGSDPVRDPVPGVQPAPHKPSFLGTCAPGQSSSKTAAWARCHRDRRARSRGSARRHQLCRAEETICRHGLPEMTPWGAVSRARNRTGNRIQRVSRERNQPCVRG